MNGISDLGEGGFARRDIGQWGSVDPRRGCIIPLMPVHVRCGRGGGGVAGHGIIPLMPGFSGRHWGAFYNSTCRDHAKLACVHIAVTAMCPPYQTFAEAAVKSGFFSREQHCTFFQRTPNIHTVQECYFSFKTRNINNWVPSCASLSACIGLY